MVSYRFVDLVSERLLLSRWVAKKRNDNARAPDGEPWPAKVKRLRVERGLSQRELGTKSGVSHVTIARLETGDQIPRGATLRKLLETIEKIPKLPNI
jgi:DNA-binding XRE family transcriptional regulator